MVGCVGLFRSWSMACYLIWWSRLCSRLISGWLREKGNDSPFGWYTVLSTVVHGSTVQESAPNFFPLFRVGNSWATTASPAPCCVVRPWRLV
jgi:hypothetical protein